MSEYQDKIIRTNTKPVRHYYLLRRIRKVYKDSERFCVKLKHLGTITELEHVSGSSTVFASVKKKAKFEDYCDTFTGFFDHRSQTLLLGPKGNIMLGEPAHRKMHIGSHAISYVVQFALKHYPHYVLKEGMLSLVDVSNDPENLKVRHMFYEKIGANPEYVNDIGSGHFGNVKVSELKTNFNDSKISELSLGELVGQHLCLLQEANKYQKLNFEANKENRLLNIKFNKRKRGLTVPYLYLGAIAAAFFFMAYFTLYQAIEK